MSTFDGFHADVSRPWGPRRSRRWIKFTALAVALAVVAGAAFGWYVLNHYSSNIERRDVFPSAGMRPAATVGDAKTVLVIGSDTRKGLSAAERRELSTGKSECNCTDTIMLVRMGEDTEGATIVSFPRDLMVDVPAFTDRSGAPRSAAVRQINTLYALGGPELLIRALEDTTDVRIDHYVQVRFSGVVDVVDAIGGVDVCVRKSFSDTNTHLALSAGTHTLDGVDALKYVRLRHVGDGSDLSRIQRQQQFVVNTLASATSAGVIANPFRLKRVLDAATSSIVVDQDFATTDLLSFARRLHAADRKDLVLLTVPNQAYAPDPNRVALLQPQADAVFAKLKANQPVKAKSAKKASASTHARSGTSNPCTAPA